MDFLRFYNVTFASVDISSDKKVLARTWNIEIPRQYHFDIQKEYHVPGNSRPGMSTLAALLIDPWYKAMKSKMTGHDHQLWEQNKLPMKNIKYAAIDGFVAYELYRKILLQNDT